MTMNKEQLAQFKYNYCEKIIEDMDLNTLMVLAHDLLMDSYQSCTEEEIKEEIHHKNTKEEDKANRFLCHRVALQDHGLSGKVQRFAPHRRRKRRRRIHWTWKSLQTLQVHPRKNQ